MASPEDAIMYGYGSITNDAQNTSSAEQITPVPADEGDPISTGEGGSKSFTHLTYPDIDPNLHVVPEDQTIPQGTTADNRPYSPSQPQHDHPQDNTINTIDNKRNPYDPEVIGLKSVPTTDSYPKEEQDSHNAFETRDVRRTWSKYQNKQLNYNAITDRTWPNGALPQGKNKTNVVLPR